MSKGQSLEETVDMYYDDDVARALAGSRLLYSVYNSSGYQGDWLVVFVDNGQLMVDTGSHCSCNGPVWAPSSTTKEELLEAHPYEDGLKEALESL
jgi:hypothetical protein